MTLRTFIRANWTRICQDKHRLAFLVDEHPDIYTQIQKATGKARLSRKDVYDLAFEPGRCKTCDKTTRWYSKRYADFCSGKCRDRSPEVTQAKQKAWSKFEGGHPSADPKIREKIKKKWLRNHRVDNPVHLSKTKRALKAFWKDKAKVDTSTKKRHAALIKRFGDLPFRTPEVMENRRTTRIELAQNQEQTSRERLYAVCIDGVDHWFEGSGPVVALRLAAAGIRKITSRYTDYPDIRYTTPDGKSHRYWPDLMFKVKGKVYVVEVKSPYTLGVYSKGASEERFATNVLKFKAAQGTGLRFLLAVVVKHTVVWIKNPARVSYKQMVERFSKEPLDNTGELMKILSSV